MIQVPDLEYGNIPYSRVYHNKYLTTEKEAYVGKSIKKIEGKLHLGTSNWSADYWLYTAGIGIAIRSDDISQQSALVQQINSIFERDWNSNYTLPLAAFIK